MLRLATFNAGLAVGVLPRVTERLPHVIAALAALDVDVLFVQEFWLDAHWDELKLRLQSRLPHAVRPAALNSKRGRCTAEQLSALRACADAHCAGLRDEALARCVVKHCTSVALALPVDCLNCIATHPSGTLQQIFERCMAEAEPPGPGAAQASSQGGLIAYGGSFGTGLFTRYTPLETDTVTFEATLNARGAIWVLLDVPGLGRIHVFAAHLSPGGQEQQPQVERLLTWIEEKAGSESALLLGDLNLTPASALFTKINRAGFREPGLLDLRGTYSREGLLNGRFGESGWRLDHVLLRAPNLSLNTERILDEGIVLGVNPGGEASTLSDHAGLLATVSLRGS